MTKPCQTMVPAMQTDETKWGDTEFTIHALNIHGTFFERWCQHTVASNEHWELRETNYPVEFPRGGTTQSREGALDLWAQRDFGSGVVVSLITECKKNNPEYSTWVFFKRQSRGRRLVGNRYLNGVQISQAGGSWDPTVKPFCPRWNLPVADEGREVKSNYRQVKAGDRSRTANREITDAANQVALATQSCLLDEYYSCAYAQGRGSDRPYEFHYFLPVVVTTAELLLCTFDPAAVDAGTGEVPLDEPRLKQVGKLLFEYPLPSRLQRDTDPARRAGEELDPHVRLHILIVRSTELDSLLTDLAEEPADVLGHNGFGF